jgi:hypothetical protein
MPAFGSSLLDLPFGCEQGSSSPWVREGLYSAARPKKIAIPSEHEKCRERSHRDASIEYSIAR